MLTAVAGFTSMLTLTGAYKQLAFSLPVVVIICLIASFLISILVTPLMSYFFLKKSNKDKPKRTQKLADAYDKLFQLAFVNKKKTILIAIIFLLVCASSAAFIKLELTAKSNKDVITIEVAGNDENDMGKTRAVVEQIGKILDKQPEVTNYLSGIGIGIPRYEYSVLPKGQGDAVGDIMVRINLDDSKRFKMTKDMVAYLQKDLDSNITGGKAIVDELGIMAFMSKPIEMKLYSDDLSKLNAAADMVSSVMKKTEGTANITDRNAISTYHYYVDMNNNQLNSLGLTKAEVQNELSLALLGRDVSLYRQNGKEYSVFLESNINNLEDLKNFEVKSSTAGYKYSIQQFADVTLTPQLTEIDRINGQRGRTVGCYAAARYSSIAVQKDVEQNLKGIKLPDGVTMEKSGDEKDFQKFVNSILAAALFSFVLILLLLLLQFNSLKKSLMVFISVPFGAAAGVAGLYLTGQHLAMFALLGMISLMGVVMANAIVLIEYIDSERKQGVSISEACRTAGAKRFRPILISTMTAVLGLSPLAVNGDPLFKPMATLLLIGLIVSMIINLIIVPIIYDMVYDKEDPILNQP
jgi:multidrug efflux pump subunit AcrB